MACTEFCRPIFPEDKFKVFRKTSSLILDVCVLTPTVLRSVKGYKLLVVSGSFTIISHPRCYDSIDPVYRLVSSDLEANYVDAYPRA